MNPSDINCRELVELLIDFVSEELEAERRALVERHLGECPPCAVYLETYRMTIRVTKALPKAVPLPPELERRLLEALKRMREQEGGGS
jgi:anti-sigma factor RsiW